jgi:rare lipoprotein A
MGWIGLAMLVGLAIALVWFWPAFARAGEVCTASYYGGGKGEKLAKYTASGAVFDHRQMTAAHRSWPFGTRVRVTHLGNGRSVIVKINDRGPARATRRCIDVTRAAAEALDMIHDGTARVRIDILN